MDVSDRLRADLPVLARYLLALVPVAAVTVVIALLGPLQLANASMLYLAAVLLIAIFLGRGPAIASAVGAFLTFNFFFVEPRYTFSVANPDAVLALLTFLLVAIVTGQLAAAQRGRAEEAEAREREARLLHDITDLLVSRPFQPGLEAVAERLRTELALEAVAIEMRSRGSGLGRVAAGDPEAIRAMREATSVSVLSAGKRAEAEQSARPGKWVRIAPPHGARQDTVPHGMIRVPIRGSQPKPLGDLVLVSEQRAPTLGPRDARLLSTAARQLASAIEQERLRVEANETEVLRRTSELKSALLDAVSHDLRTPLASIIASAGSLRQRDITWTDDERRELAEAMEEEAQRLNRIVGNLLDLSRIQGGALVPARDWHDPSLVVRDAVERLRPALREHRLEVDVPTDPRPVLLDPVEIDQVVANLVENAAKYSKPGETIQVDATLDSAELRVTVSDDGVGITESSLPRLFEPFYRGPQPTGIRGSGLGLAVAQGLVQAHGGRIWAENRPEGGARFTFSIPAPPVAIEATS